jgi:hypothetical protein
MTPAYVADADSASPTDVRGRANYQPAVRDDVGEANAIPQLFRQVQETVFKARDVKMRTVDANARPIVRLLNATELANGKGERTVKFRPGSFSTV